MENQEIAFNNEMAALNNEKGFWENDVLRITNIYPNQEIGRTFFMPIIQGAGIVKIVIRFNGASYEFLYNQTCGL